MWSTDNKSIINVAENDVCQLCVSLVHVLEVCSPLKGKKIRLYFATQQILPQLLCSSRFDACVRTPEADATQIRLVQSVRRSCFQSFGLGGNFFCRASVILYRHYSPPGVLAQCCNTLACAATNTLGTFVRDCDKTTAPFLPAALGTNHALAYALATLQTLLPFFRVHGPIVTSKLKLMQTTLAQLESQLEAAVLHICVPRPLVARTLWGLLAQLDLMTNLLQK
jgi:hypothetical protein